MEVSKINFPQEIANLLREFKDTPYYKYGVQTLKLELVETSQKTLHNSYQEQLRDNVIGREWLKFWANPEFAWKVIKELPGDPISDTNTLNAFMYYMSMMEFLETDLTSQNAISAQLAAVRTYVGKINSLVSEEWWDKVDALWDRLMDEGDVVRYIKSRKGELFSKNKVYHIIAFLILEKVYKPVSRQEEISYLLEDGDQNEIKSHRSQLSKALPLNIADIVEMCVKEVG